MGVLLDLLGLVFIAAFAMAMFGFFLVASVEEMINNIKDRRRNKHEENDL